MKFNPPIQEKWKNIVFENSRIKIKTFPVTVNSEPSQDLIACEAEITLQSLPTLDNDKNIEIPTQPRRELEIAIENLANMLAITEMSKRTISSTHPCIGFRTQTEDELSWLNQTNGITYNLKMIPSFKFTVEDAMKNSNFLQDRLEGVALMAESMANTHVSGKLHELMRVFENAFATSSDDLVDKMSSFLNDSPFQLSKEDIDYMIKYLRDRSTHADTNRPIMMESDIRSHIYKMEEIAYDILFNKTNWHTPDINRRDILKPKAGVKGDDTLFTYQYNANFVYMGQILDPFGSFPFTLAATIQVSIYDELSFIVQKSGVTTPIFVIRQDAGLNLVKI